jgi:hypothetical protein
LRDANAYILVYDLLCPDSFDYISGLFSQVIISGAAFHIGYNCSSVHLSICP